MSILIRFHQLLAAYAVWLSLLLGTGTMAQAAVDTSVTQRVWKLKFGVTDAQMYVGGNSANGLNMTWLNGDADGDGIKNIDEITTGTNPFNPGKTIAITSVARNGSNVELQFPTENGKLYRVEFTTTLANAGSWALHGSPTPGQWIGNGSPQMFTLPYVANTFYRIRVDELDSDGDGVSDWVEAETSLNPNSATTVTGVNDHDYVTGQLALPSVVSIHATKSFASEDGPDAGTFTVSRTQKLLPITVHLTPSGTAVAGSDYSALPASVTFTSGIDSLPVPVNPVPDNTVEGSKSVTASLQGPGGSGETGFTLGSNTSATVIINDSTVPIGTGLLARYYDHANGIYAHAANFGDLANYNYVRTTTTTGTITLTPTTGNTAALLAALNTGDQVRLSFNGGNLNNALYNHLNYTVTAETATTFTVAITGTSLPTNSASNCYFSVQPIHPAVLERVDPMVNFEWMGGTANGSFITPANSPENYSSVWEGYLHPTTAGSYQFQLDADDKARVLLDLDNNGVFDLPAEQVIEHGWDGPATVGTFKQSAPIALVVPGAPAQRYRIRVEHVETTGEARCRLQWRLGTAGYGNIPQANIYLHASSANYNYTRGGTAPNYTGSVVVTLNGHGYAVGNQADLAFSTGNLFTPANGNFHGAYTITAVTTNTFTVSLPSGPTLPASGSGAGYVLDQPTSTTTGWLNYIYANGTADFTVAPGRIGVDGAGPNNSNNGFYSTGSPDPSLIAIDSFSVRWTGQVQPQFTEEYTFIVQADDGCTLRINGELQDLKMLPAANNGGSTYTYDSATGNTVVNYANSALKPSSIVVGETLRLDAANGILALGNGSTYTYDSVSGNAVINYSNLTNVTPGGFAVGDMVEVDPTSGNVNLGQVAYQITAATATTFTVNFGAGLFPSGSGSINVSDFLNRIVTAVTPTTFTVNFDAGNYVNGSGNMNFDFGSKSLKDWSSNGNERYVRIPVTGGVRYDIELDYWESGGFSRCNLFWYSPSQPRQLIPTERLYPSNGVLAPAAHTSGSEAVALIGGAFSHEVSGTNGGNVTVSGNPAWLTYSNGVLSGTPPAGTAGDYQVIITITNAEGTSTSVLNLRVADTAGTIVREYWNGVAGSGVAAIPLNDPPDGTGNLTTLEGPTNFGDDYGARIRGYITAPVTGNYYFWIAATNAAELWISNDSEPVNALKRAWVANGTASQEWNNAGEPSQKSPWLALEAGKRYYIEILQKAGTGSGDNLAVGWLKPGETGTAPSEIVPSHVLDPYVAPAPGSTPGTLYIATMLSQNGAATDGVGTSTLRLSEDENYGYMKRSYSGLTGPITSEHIHTDPYLAKVSTIVFDIDQPITPGDGLITNPSDPNYTGTDPQTGTYKWTILPVGTLTKADIIEIIKQGKSYVNLHTAANPGGEIRGNYTLASGSRTFTPPPPPPALVDDDHTTNTGAARFLTQASFGPNIADLTALKAMASYDAWIDDQFTKPVSYQLPEVMRTENANAQGGAFDEPLTFNAWWKNSISGPDQLRQRVAFALSEILVVSAQGPLDARADALSFFYDRLAENAFGNFRDILETTTKTWAMGRYLDMWRNDKPDPAIGRIPNENYAREIKQLFSIGLYRMWPDGTLILDSTDSPIATYTQREIVGFAHVFTGWDYGYDGDFRTFFGAPTNFARLMREVPARHFTGPKRLLNNEVLPGLATLGNQPLDPYGIHSTQHFGQAAYQNLPEQELDISHDQLFNHPNVGPFICRQLIQRLVTSHPSRDYLYRVVQKFNDNGAGVRGDMQAVIKAILLDYEARSSTETTKPAFGKQREPVMRIAAAGRAFRTEPLTGTYSQAGTPTITVTTSAPHKLSNGNQVFLEFTSGNPPPWIGAYSATSTGTNTFTVQAQGWITGTYNQPANSAVMTITMTNHWLEAGQKAYFDFTTGPANGVAGLDNTVFAAATSNSVDRTAGTSFTITAPTSPSVRSGNVMIPRFSPGSYTIGDSGLAAPFERRGTMDTNFDHHLNVGDQVQLNFYGTNGGSVQPNDMVVTVESVPDLNTWTFVATSAGNNLQSNQGYNEVFQFPLVSQPLTRSGNLATRSSTFNLGNTDPDIDQSPLNSITVFNFFLPDYKFPGALAAQGITTPEFQTTAETTVIRQANFLFNGIFNPGNTNGISSFKSGTNALVMDFSPWMGNATDNGLGAGPQTAQAWTSNANLDTLIERLNTLLVAGQLSTQAKTIIGNFVGRPITSISTGNPCSINIGTAHGLQTGDVVTITGVTGGIFSPAINATYTITVTGANTFTVPVNCTSTASLIVANSTAGIIPYTTTAPTDTQKRDRLRAIIHLILTSPDFTIQR